MLEHARGLAEAGYCVFPLVPKSKIPLIEGGVKNATTDLIQIEKWWTENPNANIGVAMGKKSGIFGLDIDFKDGCESDFPQKLPPTVMTKTPLGGLHAFFKYPVDGIKNNKKIATGVTVRAEGYYFVAPPSIHPDTGTSYEFLGRGLADGEVLESPDWIIQIPNLPIKTLGAIGQRHDTLVTRATHFRKKGMERELAIKELMKLNNKFEGGPKPLEEVFKAVEWAWQNVAEEQNAVSDKMSEEEIEILGKEILDIRFKLVANEETSIIYNIKDISKKEVTICNNEEYLLRRLRQNIIEKIGMTPTENFLNKVFFSWKLSTTAIKQPLPFAWQDQDEWTFKKLDFVPCEGIFDSWKEFLLRLSSPEDFMAFVWSIFEARSKSRQYLYLFDPNGQGGKSTVLGVLGEVLGNAYCAINNSFVGSDASRWLMGNLIGKRLVGWPDCKNTRFCMTELLRNITSGDEVTVEFKGKQPFTTRMYVKFILASNHEPSITGGGADLSRLIRIDVSENQNSKNDPAWKDRLRAELPHFLHECKSWYDKKCHSHGDINLESHTNELGRDSTMEIEAKYSAIAEKHLEFSPEYETSNVDWTKLCHEYNLNGMEIGNFKDYLRQGHGVFFKRVQQGGHKLIKGIGFKVFEFGKTTQITVSTVSTVSTRKKLND